MKIKPGFLRLLLILSWVGSFSPRAADYQVLGWNNLGMHCLDSDYSVFSILPPYNTIEAQLIVDGRLQTRADGYTVTYEAVADPDGSFNSTAMEKGNFYQFATALYGAQLAPEAGLAGWSMPGTNNTPQAMLFESTNRPAAGVETLVNWFRAEGIPIAPFDDAGRKNYYPLMRLIARNAAGAAVASNDIVLPVSDEMDCRTCHASGTQTAAQPAAGWVWSGNSERDFRLNILRLHDEHQFATHAELYQEALAARQFNPLGLYRGVVADGKPVLCATCHASEALGTASFGTISPLTAAVHSKHATVMDPELNLTLDSSSHRAACYRCHPGSATRCLRGAMGGAIASDGSMAMQCQSCHGSMSQVGSRDRVGWFMEPNCQSCHTGSATHNNGQIRYTSVFEANGNPRVAVNSLFATQPDTPAAGLSLYRFSAGHGGLQCSACHGSTHAEFPATHRNDNLRNEKIQGHAGVTAECMSCHVSMPADNATAAGGPHGMHPIGASWVRFHSEVAESNTGRQKCAACHGADFRGSVLSRAFGPRTLTVDIEDTVFTLKLFQGATVGCFNCHNGPHSEDVNTSAAPTVQNVAAQTTSGTPVPITIPVTGANANVVIIAQPTHGSVGLSNTIATYFPDPGFVGTDTFKFAAWNGQKNSELATATVAVATGPYSVTVRALVPPEYPAKWPAAFTAVPLPVNTTAAVTYEWDFGDGSPRGTNRFETHTYQKPGTYSWKVIAQLGAESARAQGMIVVGDPIHPRVTAGPVTHISWAQSTADAVLEQAATLTSVPGWIAATNEVHTTSGILSVEVTDPLPSQFFRLRQVE
ncbi:MAG TPA: PKD domain-containing protein [Verrucomicrobiota bacterium]|nr:PKD domain-containing protein [Verrucomicrobiota bacterium]